MLKFPQTVPEGFPNNRKSMIDVELTAFIQQGLQHS